MLRVTYTRAADLVRDLEGQLVHGGLFVAVAPPAGLTLGSRIVLEIVAPDGTTLRGEGEVLHAQPHGLAVTFPAAEVARLRALASAAADAKDAGPPRHEIVTADPPAKAIPRPEAAGDVRKLDQLTTAEKIQMALHGSRDERAAILRDRNRLAHPYVLKNPQIGIDEILAIAKSGLSTPDILSQIGEKKEWLQRPAVAVALARNPKTPQGLGLRALDHVPIADVRQIARSNIAPPHVTEAAKRKVIKP